jgi:hypothetical protein
MSGVLAPLLVSDVHVFDDGGATYRPSATNSA